MDLVQLEAHLLTLTRPVRILESLAVPELDQQSAETSIRVLLWKTYGNGIQTEYADFSQNFEFYTLANPPPPLPPVQDNIIEGEVVSGLRQVTFDGVHAIRMLTFSENHWFGSSLTLENPVDHPHFKTGFINSVRIIANALLALKVYNERFIRADHLIDTFYQGMAVRRRLNTKARKFALKYLHSVTAEDLWGHGHGNMKIIRWVAEHYFGEDSDIAFEGVFYQIRLL